MHFILTPVPVTLAIRIVEKKVNIYFSRNCLLGEKIRALGTFFSARRETFLMKKDEQLLDHFERKTDLPGEIHCCESNGQDNTLSNLLSYTLFCFFFRPSIKSGFPDNGLGKQVSLEFIPYLLHWEISIFCFSILI